MQGFNMGRYVPPEFEGRVSGNKLAGKHALGNRARKLDQGILVVRFEMPFAIWCTNCKPEPVIIGQGVRFNAEKKKIGNYLSSPIYSFRMKHTVCGEWIEIHTDPKNTAYVVASGGKKRETGAEEIKIRPAVAGEGEEGKDALEVLEGKVEDKRHFQSNKQRIEELKNLRDRDWSDPYDWNRKLRKTFREDRNIRKAAAKRTEDLRERFGLDIELLQESAADEERAKLVDFENGLSDKPDAAQGPLFSRKRSSGVLNTSKMASTKEKLQKQLAFNTRAAADPFLLNTIPSSLPSSKVKRKRPAEDIGDKPTSEPTLVDYDTD